MNNSLREIALNINKKGDYKTDKAGGRGAMEKYNHSSQCHELAELYDYLFSSRRNEELDILEVGICHGGGTKMLSEYFIKSKCYAVDITMSHLKIALPESITTFCADAYSSEFVNHLKSLNLLFDIIIDDGPHTEYSQRVFIKNYVSFLKPGGTIIIEDIADISLARSLHEQLLPYVSFSFIVDRTALTTQPDEITLVGKI